MSGQVYSEPFAQIPEWILDAEISDRAVRTFCVLQRHANKQGRAFPGRTSLSERLNCSKASLDRSLNELRDIGAITTRRIVEANAIVGNDYWLWPAQPPSPVTTGRRTDDATGGRTDAPRVGALVMQQEREPINESQENESHLLPVVASDDKPKRPTAFPAEFFVTPEMRAWAADKAPTVDVNAETEQFCDYHRAKGDTAKDWTASWRTWMRNAVKFARGTGRRDNRPQAEIINSAAAKVEARRVAGVPSLFAVPGGGVR